MLFRSVTTSFAVDVYIGVIVLFSNIYPAIADIIVTIIKISAHLENFFISLSNLL